ncbi:hypothetical protein N0V90_013539 [Kalmusia sp. IMI 367209]|nr:hypothetical protein N0V90_013539 [Kalmusia sp. IMI 367209]
MANNVTIHDSGEVRMKLDDFRKAIDEIASRCVRLPSNVEKSMELAIQCRQHVTTGYLKSDLKLRGHASDSTRRHQVFNQELVAALRILRQGSWNKVHNDASSFEVPELDAEALTSKIEAVVATDVSQGAAEFEEDEQLFAEFAVYFWLQDMDEIITEVRNAWFDVAQGNLPFLLAHYMVEGSRYFSECIADIVMARNLGMTHDKIVDVLARVQESYVEVVPFGPPTPPTEKYQGLLSGTSVATLHAQLAIMRSLRESEPGYLETTQAVDIDKNLRLFYEYDGKPSSEAEVMNLWEERNSFVQELWRNLQQKNASANRLNQTQAEGRFRAIAVYMFGCHPMSGAIVAESYVHDHSITLTSELLLESTYAYFSGSRKVVRLLTLEQEIEDIGDQQMAINPYEASISFAREVRQCTYPILTNARHSQDIESLNLVLTAHRVATYHVEYTPRNLLEQTPCGAGVAIWRTYLNAMKAGIALCNTMSIVGCVFHLYNVLVQLEELSPIAWMESCIGVFGDKVFALPVRGCHARDFYPAWCNYHRVAPTQPILGSSVPLKPRKFDGGQRMTSDFCLLTKYDVPHCHPAYPFLAELLRVTESKNSELKVGDILRNKQQLCGRDALSRIRMAGQPSFEGPFPVARVNLIKIFTVCSDIVNVIGARANTRKFHEFRHFSDEYIRQYRDMSKYHIDKGLRRGLSVFTHSLADISTRHLRPGPTAFDPSKHEPLMMMRDVLQAFAGNKTTEDFLWSSELIFGGI